MRYISEFTHVVFKSSFLFETHPERGRVQLVVVRQDRLMPITYVERHYRHVMEIEATMMPAGSDVIHIAREDMSQTLSKYEIASHDLKFRMYRNLRRQLMDAAEKGKEVTA